VFKSVKILFLSSLIFAGLFPEKIHAQIDDVGLWLGLAAQKQITRQWEASLGEQLRLNHDLTSVNQLLTDIGVAYSITKKFKAGINYRFINSNQENYYSKRHRFYMDLSYKEKTGSVTFTLRERIQSQFSDYYSSEDGKVPVWTLRSKLTSKFDIEKKYSPYLSGEIYYLFDSPKEIEGYTRYRIETGINYDFNRIHSLNPFILYQHIISPPFDELIYGMTYTYNF
jgi:hypothetical protein